MFSDFSKKTRKPNFEIWPWDPSRSLSHVLLSNMAQELCQTALLRSVSSHFKFSLELWSAGRLELLARLGSLGGPLGVPGGPRGALPGGPWGSLGSPLENHQNLEVLYRKTGQKCCACALIPGSARSARSARSSQSGPSSTARDLPSTRAGGQDDVSSKETSSN